MCLCKLHPESTFLDSRVKVSASISFQAKQEKKLFFLKFFHNISLNCLLQIFIPLATAGAPGHLLKSLPMHKDEFFELTQCLLPCSEVFSSNSPTRVSQLVPSAGSPGQDILALRGGWKHSLSMFCVKVFPSLEGNLGRGLAVPSCAHLRAT